MAGAASGVPAECALLRSAETEPHVIRDLSAAAFLMSVFVAAGCGGAQSALEPAGRDAEWMANLFIWITGAFVMVWLGVVALAVYAPRARSAQYERAANPLIIGGGVALPVVVLSALLLFGFSELPRVLAPAPDGDLAIEVSGSQWWWRVRYFVRDRAPIELANEVHLPVGRRLNTRLVSADVVHSFWIPAIAGKMDMIPGRINRLVLEPTRVGTFRGACAEYCGTSHARMNLVAVVSDQQTFDAWLANQGQSAVAPSDPGAQRGQHAFFERGCSTCHSIRGTAAVGVTGPDLTHVGSRQTLAAGMLSTNVVEFRRWIGLTELLKPGVHMPAFANLPDEDLAALAAYLVQLK
jgi:cytochrome c oxidase subunit II